MYAGVDEHNRTKIGATRKGSGRGIKIKKEVSVGVYAQRGVVWIKKANGVRERHREVSNQEGACRT